MVQPRGARRAPSRPLMIKASVSEKSTKLGRSLHLRGRVNNISGKAINSGGNVIRSVWSIIKALAQISSDSAVKKQERKREQQLSSICIMK